MPACPRLLFLSDGHAEEGYIAYLAFSHRLVLLRRGKLTHTIK